MNEKYKLKQFLVANKNAIIYEGPSKEMLSASLRDVFDNTQVGSMMENDMLKSSVVAAQLISPSLPYLEFFKDSGVTPQNLTENVIRSAIKTLKSDVSLVDRQIHFWHGVYSEVDWGYYISVIHSDKKEKFYIEDLPTILTDGFDRLKFYNLLIVYTDSNYNSIKEEHKN